MSDNTQIQIKRSTLAASDAKISGLTLNFGEPLYLNSEKYLMIGDGTSACSTLPRFKAYSAALADNQVLFKLNQDNTYSLIKDDGTTVINPSINGQYIPVTGYIKSETTYDNADSAITNLNNRLESTESKTVNLEANAYYAKSTSTLNGTAINSDKVTINETTSNTDYYITGVTAAGSQSLYRAYNANGSANTSGVRFNGASGVLYGAAWNDFAEFRKCKEEAGTVVVEVGDGSLERSYDRLQKGAAIVSDTYGMVIGPEGDDYKPIAVAGRVLVNTFERNLLKAGDAVCTDEYGGVSKMKWWEVILHPDCIVGYVSEIPTYPVWNGVLVENRIWIKVK